LLFFFVTLLLQACGTLNYVPKKYEITGDRIENIPLSGIVVVVNSQRDASKKLIIRGWEGDLKTVTEHLKIQLEEEIIKNSTPTQSSNGENKTIEIKVTKMKAEQGVMTLSSEMDLEYSLGNGEIGLLHVSNVSPANIWRLLNGSIALGVIELLKDSKVRTYLSK
jgi:hypothetical protein